MKLGQRLAGRLHGQARRLVEVLNMRAHKLVPLSGRKLRSYRDVGELSGGRSLFL